MAVVDKEAEVPPVGRRREVISRLFGKKKETYPVVEIPEVPPEIERAEPVTGASMQLTNPVVDDQTGQVLVTATSAQQPKVVLPLTEDEIREGLTFKVIYSLRWLAEWCVRLIKIAGGVFTRKKAPEKIDS